MQYIQYLYSPTLTYLDLEAIFKHAAMSNFFFCLSGRACQGAWNEIFCEPQRAMKLNVELKSKKNRIVTSTQ